MPDIDWGQVIFLILFVIVGFVRWLGNLIEQRKEAKERASLSPEEIARREAAWRKQVGQDTDLAPVPAPTATQPPPDPFQQLKDLFEQLKEPAPKPQPQRPSTPPPLVQVQRPPAPPQRTQPPPIPALPRPAPTSVAAPTPVIAKAFPTSNFVDRSFTEAVAHRDRRTAAKLMSLRLDLRSPSALRRAIVIREILGPPKALAEE
jgi:hypothetical protein